MTEPIGTGTVVGQTASHIAQTAEEAENMLHKILQTGSTDPVDYVIAIGRLLPLLAAVKMEATGIVGICEKEQIRNRKKRRQVESE